MLNSGVLIAHERLTQRWMKRSQAAIACSCREPEEAVHRVGAFQPDYQTASGYSRDRTETGRVRLVLANLLPLANLL
jgi:hypothetical protein